LKSIALNPSLPMQPTTTTSDAITFRELLAYTGNETARWEAWLRGQDPAILNTPFGEGSRATVGELIFHVFMVERRYADRLLGEEPTPYEAVPHATLDELFAAHHEGRAKLLRFVEGASDDDWARTMTFQTITAGTMTGSARKVVAHALVHGVRHWAQIATALRQAGHPQPWMHDLLADDALS
jgi:uncharacterized damage-inducible protein DinB